MSTKPNINLYNADCLEILKTLPNDSIDAIITDPPYAITVAKWDRGLPWSEIWIELKRVAKPKTPIVLFAAQPFTSLIVSLFIKQYRYQWVWEKNTATNHLNAKKQPLRNTEDILVFSFDTAPTYYPQMIKGGKPYERIRNKPDKTTLYGKTKLTTSESLNGDRYPKTVLKFSKPQNGQNYHPSQKPQDLLQYLIQTYTKPNNVILDFCMGSGSTGVAAKELNRGFIGLELDTGFYEIAKTRIN